MLFSPSLGADKGCGTNRPSDAPERRRGAGLTLVRERRGEDLEAWRTQAAQSGLEPLARFAAGLQEDLAAIPAGLTLPWSNGVTEGHVNRLKLRKRQAYGCAHVALLRQRILQKS